MADTNVDVFGVKAPDFLKPITADTATLIWTGQASGGTASSEIMTGANNVQISYQRAVNRRFALGKSKAGGPVAVIYPSRPMGSLSMSHLFIDVAYSKSLFDYAGWNSCKDPATITVKLGGSNNDSALQEGCSGTTQQVYVLRGALVTGWNLQMEADGLTVLQGVQVEFLHMSIGG